MKELADIRKELDAVDRDIVHLFEQRMGLVEQVAAYKISKGIPVLDTSREAQVLDSRAAMLEQARFDGDVRVLFECIMALSRKEQERLMKEAKV